MTNTQNLTLVIILIVAASLVLLGSCLFVVTMSIIKWDFSVLGVKNVTNEHAISEDFTSISVNTDTADVTFLPSEDESCRVVCVEPQKLSHSVTVVDSVLKIEEVDSRAWYEHISIFSRPTGITVYLPRSEYASLCVKATTSDVKVASGFTFEGIDVSVSTGDIDLEGISTGALKLSASTGKISAKSVSCTDVSVKVTTGTVCLKDVSCKSLTSSGGTGDITLTNVVASESFSIERSTGDVKLEDCDASTLNVKTRTGDVRGTLLTEKIFFTNTSTGKVDVPRCTSGGSCDISTTTGDIAIEIK